MDFDCDTCGGRKIRIDYCDAYCCLACNEWQEEKCSDPTCSYCKKRSEKPFTEEELTWLNIWIKSNPGESLEDYLDEHFRLLGKY